MTLFELRPPIVEAPSFYVAPPYQATPYFTTMDPIILVNPIIDAVSIEDFQTHVNSPTPHPAYDDIQSLVGIFENGLA